MSLDQLPFNIFDLVLVAVLLAGLMTGRKHGMSEELLSLLKWLTIVLVCGLFYAQVGRMVAESSPFSLLYSFMMAYICGLILIFAGFGLFKHSLGGKLVGSDIFGRAEYYLGMGSGVVRFACMLLAALALLNARFFTPAEVQAMDRYQDEWYGKSYFPTWHTAQEVVFERSLAGSWIKQHLSFLLIEPTVEEDKQFHQQQANLP